MKTEEATFPINQTHCVHEHACLLLHKDANGFWFGKVWLDFEKDDYLKIRGRDEKPMQIDLYRRDEFHGPVSPGTSEEIGRAVEAFVWLVNRSG